MKNKIAAFVGVILSWSVMAQTGYSQDSGQIAEVFASQTGAIAIRLSNGYKNGIAAGQCPGGWHLGGACRSKFVDQGGNHAGQSTK